MVLMMGTRKPLPGFARDLQLIHPDLKAVWNPKTCRWVILQGKSPRFIVQNPKTQAYRPLDNRILRKIRVDYFFTLNPKALDHYLENDAYAMYSYTERGMQGLSDYLSGYNEGE